MTAACLALLAAANRPLWPWSKARTGVIAEAFPAAQLVQWQLRHTSYSGASAEVAKNRETILVGLRKRIHLPPELESQMRSSADALDVVICAFSGIAVTQGELAAPAGPSASDEGWIAVHS
jgi:hypothetical protein